jgi:peroxiredoxin
MTHTRLYFLVALAMAACMPLQAAQIRVSGTSTEYQNYTISFSVYDDLITMRERSIGTCETDVNGAFSLTLSIEKTCQVFCYLGVYKAIFYAEPGRDYQLVLPPRKDKGLVEDLNPYFEHQQLSIGIANTDSTELNYCIMQFNMEYEPFITNTFSYLYYTSDIKPVDSLKKVLSTQFGGIQNTFFHDYMFYKFAFLYHFALERDKVFATRKYFCDKPVLYQNPAYMDFFNQLWGKYFTDQAVTEPLGEIIKSNIVYSKSPAELEKTLEKNPVLRDPAFKELVILKGLHDCLSRPAEFITSTVIQTIDSIHLKTKIPEHTIISGNMLALSKRIKPSDIAPDFTLPDTRDSLYSLSSFRGKFVYLVFGRSENYACLKDYRMVASIHKSKLPSLEIVTVSCDQDRKSFDEFVKLNPQFTWTFLYDEGKNVASLFQQKVLPGYVLIDPDGKIAMIPAASPHENFKNLYPQIRIWRQRALSTKKK